MKTILFAAMALLGSSAFGAAVEGTVQAQGQDQKKMPMEQLVAKCLSLQNYGQTTTIDAQITCSADRDVWVNRGVKGQGTFAAPSAGVQFAAHVKGKYQSQQYAVDLSDLLNNIPLLLQKWRFAFIKTITVKSCQDLQAIADNPNYCAQQCSQLTDQNLQQLVIQKAAREKTTIESDNISGELVEEMLTSPLTVTPTLL